MKTMRIVTMVCWGITALAIAGLAVWFLTGGVARRGNTGWSIGVGWEALSGPYEPVGVHYVPVGNLDSLDIDWVAGEITVRPYEGADIQITELAQRELDEDEKLHFDTSDSTLLIKYQNRNTNLRRMPQKRLEVLIPRAFAEGFDSFKISSTSGAVVVSDVDTATFKVSSVSGGVQVSDVTAQTLAASSTSGRITLDTIQADSINLKSVSGAIRVSSASAKMLDCNTTSGALDLSGVYGSVDVKSISGRVSVTSETVPDSLTVNTTSGGVVVTVPDEGTVSVKHSSVSGSFSSDIPILMQNNDAQFRFSSVSGSIRILAY